jgi:predicted permease
MPLIRRVRNLFRRSRLAQEIDEELRAHIDMRTADNTAAGMPPDAARRDALLRFGNPALMKERVAREDALVKLADIKNDLRFALRQLERHRGFAITSILTLALGIGATAAIYSILNAWLFQPLPLKDPQRLAIFWRASVSNPGEPLYFFNWIDYLYFRDHSQAFQSLGASFHRNYALTGNGEPEAVVGQAASVSLFSTLGVSPFRGRLFASYDVTNAPVAVISHSFWTRKFHRSQSALGTTMVLNDKRYKIIGILPPGFSYRILDQPQDPQVWTLIQSDDPQYQPGSEAAVAIVGRLKPTVTIAQAQAEISLLQEQNDKRFHGWKTASLLVGLQRDNTRTVRPSLLVLGGAVALLLLIACTNVASLILGRSLHRQREFAIRGALGSSARRLLVQVTTENLVLYAVSGLLGLLIAWLSIRGVTAWNPFGILPPRPMTLNWHVLALTAAVTLMFGLLFGAYPAFRVIRAESSQSLRLNMTSFAGARQMQSRRIIVVMQIALSLVLLVGAYFLLSTFLTLSSESPGFRVAGAQVVELSLPKRRYESDDQIGQFTDNMLRSLRSLPGVDAAGITFFPPLEEEGAEPFQMEGSDGAGQNHLPQAAPMTVDSGYFAAMGIPFLTGRDFEERDHKNTPPVVIINGELAERYFGSKNPLGDHIRIGDPKSPETENSPWFEIVGVVGNIKSGHYDQLASKAFPQLYTDYRQKQIHQSAANWDYTQMEFIVHSPPGVKLSDLSVRRAVWSVDPNLPIGEIKSFDEIVGSMRAHPRVRAQLLSGFAALTLGLAAIGIYGVMAESVTQRYREIGVRIALGADRGRVIRLVLRQALLLTLSGVVAGLLMAVVAVRLLRGMLYGISPSRPGAYIAVAFTIVMVTLLASLLPARRAVSIDLSEALRTE